MVLSTLTIALKGPLWMVYQVEVENIEVTGKWEEGDGEGIVELKDVYISDDDALDVFISLAAPNRTTYTVEITGKIKDEKPGKISYSKNFEVTKNGKLKIQISETLETLMDSEDE